MPLCSIKIASIGRYHYHASCRQWDDRRQADCVSLALNTCAACHVEYWIKALGVTKEELQAAIDAVGHSTEKVRGALEGKQYPVRPLR